ncbi:MAG: hypothetical protein IT518_16715 [Burkholderiales bacterium]|nr:hypothetical protein [Burkholderiales bacterium]
MEDEPIYTVLDPAGEQQEVPTVSLAARLESLEGSTVYCISQFIGGADSFMKKVADALAKRVAGVKTVFVHKATAFMADDPALWDEIAHKGHAVIYGCAA